MTEPETTCKGFEVNHLVKQYANADKPVLDDISFKVEHGSVLVVLGPSGSGKSTLLRTIAGLEPIQGGTISINDRVIDAGKPGTERAGRSDRSSELRTRIGMVFQSYDLFPNKTVLGNITMAPVLVQKRDKSEVEAEAIRLLGRVGLADRKDSWPHELSGGQRQRVAIGRAIVRDPAVFLMDEPLSNLDAKLRNQMRAELIKLRERIDTTFIYVTHDQTEAMTLGDRIVIMKDGFIQQIGTPQEVFDHPANLFVAGFIGTPQMNLFDAHLARRDGKYTVTVGSVTVELSEEKQQRLAAKDVAEQDVVLGVRPDHIMLCADGVKGKVDVSEMMGSSVHLHVAAEGKDVIVIVPTNGAAAHFPAGSEVNMIFGGNVAHVFSKETEKNLEW